MPNIKKVLIVGAGPTGLLLALLLSQHGISVQVLEAGVEVDQRPRGLAYGPSATRVIRRAGLLDEIRSRTWDVRSMTWRKLGGEILAGMDSLDDQNPDRFVLYPVHLLSNLLLERVLEQRNASVYMSHPVVAVGQHNHTAWVDVKLENEIKRIEADFVVGCDGASSAVRKALFGDNFPGSTWEKQIVVHYDVHKFGWSDVQWVIDPQDWGMICGISRADQLWRIAYGEVRGLSHEELRARLPEKFEKLLPGNPKPGDYEVVRFSPFVMHQRCVEKMRVGRVLLAGDAAHLCNPMGGLGLTGGIADIGSLVDSLYGIHEGKADMDILDKYDEVRRGIYNNMIDPISSANLERLWQNPEAIKDTDLLFNTMKQAATDPKVAEQLQLMDIAHDMTKYYKATEAQYGKSGIGVSKLETVEIAVEQA